jgi:hypothetical protein
LLSIPELKRIPQFLDEFFLDDSMPTIQYELSGKTLDYKEEFFSLTVHLVFSDTDDVFLHQNRVAEHFCLILKNLNSEKSHIQFIEEQQTKQKSIVNKLFPSEIAEALLDDALPDPEMIKVACLLFCDVVSFTPWCAEQTKNPDQFAKKMGKVFELFDKACENYPTVTKIKTIGDCYMAASGLFSRDLISQVFVKELVKFGLDMIDAIN